jgi:hypothetical protein
MQDAATKLRELEQAKLQVAIEMQVASIQLLRAERKKIKSGNASAKIAKKVYQHKGKVRKLIVKWHSWVGMGLPVDNPRLQQLAEEQLLAGEFPWQSSNTVPAANLPFEYFKLRQEQKRTVEEVQYLQVDAARLFLYYSHQQQQLGAALMRIPAPQFCKLRHVHINVLLRVLRLKNRAFEVYKKSRPAAPADRVRTLQTGECLYTPKLNTPLGATLCRYNEADGAHPLVGVRHGRWAGAGGQRQQLTVRVAEGVLGMSVVLRAFHLLWYMHCTIVVTKWQKSQNFEFSACGRRDRPF